MLSVVMMRGHTALTRNKVARGSTLVHAQQHSLYIYMEAKASYRQVFSFCFSYHGQMSRRTALARACLAARLVAVTFQNTVESAGPCPIIAGQRCPIPTLLAQRPVLPLSRTTGR